MIDRKLAKKEKLKKLQQAYSKQLVDKFVVINECWYELQKNFESRELLHDMRRLIHSLAGSAGTFGFSAISSQAKKLEMLLIRIEQSGDLVADEQKKIGSMLDKLVTVSYEGPDEKTQQVNDEETTAEAEQQQSNLIVYIVEPDSSIADEIMGQLKNYGYEFKVFPSCQLMIDALANEVAKAIVINYSSEEIKKCIGQLTKLIESTPNKTPLIFTSEKGDWHTRLDAVRAGADVFITKPIDYNILVNSLTGMVNSHDIEPCRVMIVDDMLILAEHYAVVLDNAGMQTTIVNDPSLLLEAIDSFKPELILMDILMPECSGIEAGKVIRQQDEFLSVPIVFLSTEISQQSQLEALRLGGDDFLLKPISDEDLIEAVTTRSQRFRALRSMMHQDSLTGLFNHVTIKLRLESEVARAKRLSSELVFAMIDIDKFKAVNDNFGHPTGDRVIKSLAHLLKQRMRTSDIIGRYGGEEFAVIMPETNLDDAKRIFDELREQYAKLIQHYDDTQFTNTFSAGIASVSNEFDYNALIKQADSALYMAKELGRNQVCIYQDIE